MRKAARVDQLMNLTERAKKWGLGGKSQIYRNLKKKSHAVLH